MALNFVQPAFSNSTVVSSYLVASERLPDGSEPRVLSKRKFFRSSRGTRQHCSIWQMLLCCPLQQSNVVSNVTVPQFHKLCVLKRCLHCQCSTLSTTTPLSWLFLLIILHVLHHNPNCGDFPFLGATPVVLLPPPMLLSIYSSFSFLKYFETLED